MQIEGPTGFTFLPTLRGQYVAIVSDDTTQQLVLDSNGTGFLAALEIADGTAEPHEAASAKRGKGLVSFQVHKTIVQLKQVTRALNTLFDENETGFPSSFLQLLRSDIQQEVTEGFGAEGTQFRTRFGLRFDFGSDVPKVVALSEAGLHGRLRRNLDSANNLLFGDSPGEGLLENLVNLLEQKEADLAETLGVNGGLVDIFA